MTSEPRRHKLNPLVTPQEMRNLAKKLFDNVPGQTLPWDFVDEEVHDIWVGFAKFAYGTILTTLSTPEDS